MKSNVKSVLFLLFIASLIVVGVIYQQNQKNASTTTEGAALTSGITPVASAAAPVPSTSPAPSPGASLSPQTEVSPQPMTTTNTQPDLTVDANGLSKATVVLTTNQGVIKFKFYPKDAPNTVNRLIQLINSGFYNGLSFHRVVPGFVIQGGDPQGQGFGGSGQKLKAEFNERRHIEGTVAMARSSDPDSADSQFYISLGTHPHLDRSYTVFGQVIEGMDVVRKIKVGDKMTNVIIQ